MVQRSSDDYDRDPPNTVDFFHGASAVFDAFRQDKVLLTGASGASENGRGTYFTATRDQADGWSGRNGSAHSVILRISIDADTVKDSFIAHERVFSKQELVGLAIHAALNGFNRALEDFTGMANRDTPVTGRDIASFSKYNAEINEALVTQGFKGFTYADDRYDGSKLNNIIFFDTKDIPPAIPVRNTAYQEAIDKGAATPAEAVPPALQAAADKLIQAIGEKGQEMGIAPEKIAKAQDNIGILARAAADTKDYDPKTGIHPLKNAEVSIVVATETGALSKALRKETEEFVTSGMKALGVEMKPLVFEAAPAKIADPKDDPRFGDSRTIKLFGDYLDDPTKKIASEELHSARSRVLEQKPGMQKELDQLIQHFHSPALGGMDGYSMRNSLGVGLKELVRGEITPEDLVKKMEKAAYFANVDMNQSFGGTTLSKSIENLGVAVTGASPAAPAVSPDMKLKAVTR